MAPVDSPNPPTDEMMRFGDVPIFVGLERRVERADVIDDKADVGGMDGSEGVTKPYFGSAMSAEHR